MSFASAREGDGQDRFAGSRRVGPNEAPWTDIADYPATVMDNRVVYVDGVAYSIGGGNGSASNDTVYAYDPATLAWTEKASLPGARNAMSVGAVNGQIVATGGWAAAGPSTDTWVYDPAGDAWSAAADAPVSLSASGQAVVDGKLYVVGGCTTSACTPMSNDVAAYDPATDTWEQLADYPAPVAFASCGGIDGMVYCTGGNGGAAGTADSYVYDPGADSWTAIPDAPVDTWASGYTVANGMLVVNGGVQGAVITNRTLRLRPGCRCVDRPAQLQHRPLPRRDGVRRLQDRRLVRWLHRDRRQRDAARLRGLRRRFGRRRVDDHQQDVGHAWHPGESVTVRVTMDPNVAQPGTYTAGVAIAEDAPGSVEPVAVTMKVNAPATWGKLVGVVSGASCTGDAAPLLGSDRPGGLLRRVVDVHDRGRRVVRLLVQHRGEPAGHHRVEGRLRPADATGPGLPRRGDRSELHAEKGGLLTAAACMG